MGRTLKNYIYECKIYNHKDELIHNKEYHSIKEISADIELPMHSCYNITAKCRNGNYNTMYKNFIYQPKIYIIKL